MITSFFVLYFRPLDNWLNHIAFTDRQWVQFPYGIQTYGRLRIRCHNIWSAYLAHCGEKNWFDSNIGLLCYGMQSGVSANTFNVVFCGFEPRPLRHHTRSLASH